MDESDGMPVTRTRAGLPREHRKRRRLRGGLDESSPRDEVCHRWHCDGRAKEPAARWNGDSASCSAGVLDSEAAERALRVLNVHRFLAGLLPVAAEPAWTNAAQDCALVAHANAKLSHTPPRDWRCWSELGARTSGVSLIANRSAPQAITAFIEDPGNESSMVHRRWLSRPTSSPSVSVRRTVMRA